LQLENVFIEVREFFRLVRQDRQMPKFCHDHTPWGKMFLSNTERSYRSTGAAPAEHAGCGQDQLFFVSQSLSDALC
jgi:hypothetical protein